MKVQQILVLLIFILMVFLATHWLRQSVVIEHYSSPPYEQGKGLELYPLDNTAH